MIETIEIFWLAFAYIVGSLIHVYKKNTVDSDYTFKLWMKKNKYSFIIQTFIGMSVVQVLISQYPAPVTPLNWFTLLYIGVATGISGNSIGLSAGNTIRYNKVKNN